jgi:hypothetical protein
LSLYHLCKEFNKLPVAGGMLDQPVRLMRWFSYVMEAQYERQEKDAKKSEAKHARKRP